MGRVRLKRRCPIKAYVGTPDIDVYDEGGTEHTMTVYYDQVALENDGYKISGLPKGYTVYEYL